MPIYEFYLTSFLYHQINWKQSSTRCVLFWQGLHINMCWICYRILQKSNPYTRLGQSVAV